MQVVLEKPVVEICGMTSPVKVINGRNIFASMFIMLFVDLLL
jgi:hypothetical protein